MIGVFVSERLFIPIQIFGNKFNCKVRERERAGAHRRFTGIQDTRGYQPATLTYYYRVFLDKSNDPKFETGCCKTLIPTYYYRAARETSSTK
jgi:hypothetical protein